jgi:hypothetical protein
MTRTAQLVPLYLTSADDPEFAGHTARLREQLAGVADILPPVALGEPLPAADAALFPQLTGEAYRRAADIGRLSLPILVLTSDFATMAMWDWEIISYLRSAGTAVIAPYSPDGALIACRALAARRELRAGKFIVYQDEPGAGGQQPAIFRRFYWWEDECGQRIRDAFGLTIEKRSFRELGARAAALPDDAATGTRDGWAARRQLPLADVSQRATLSAVKLYQAIRDDLDQEQGVLAAGLNCLNESEYSATTPCLAWDRLYAERDLIWGCEADTISMLTKFIVHRSLRVPILMTNLYPFLMGQAALQHERIDEFPAVDGNPDDYVLAAHCGYLGVLPQQMAQSWSLREKVLAIVGEESAVIDARLPEGDLTLAKLDPSFESLVVIEGELTGYASYPGSDCRTGAVIRVPDGPAMMAGLPSHHSVLSTGHNLPGLRLAGQVFGLRIDTPGSR